MSGRITVPAASVIPQGVGAPPPPGLDPKKGKLMCIKVRMLDDTVGVFHLGHKALGQALFEEVCRHLNLLECDYFGLEFLDSVGNRCWLDKEKPILRQITAARSDARFYFVVKFYPPNPADLEEEYTRYLFALQVKRDLATGQFVVNENTAALMASYIVQSECGDYCADDYPDHTYLSSVRFIPNQSADFEKKVMENHKKIIGTSPAESDLALLETARRVEFYGVKFHPAKDIEGTAVNLTVLHLGLKVYHQLSCANTFSWAKIRKLSFKRRKFLIKLHPESYAYYKDTIEFLFENRNECKMFWKKCIEHHAFFRCSETSRMGKQQAKLFSRGSSFRYSGRTQKQLIDYIREHHRRREPFTRPIHSSFNRRYFNDRPLPTPLIPTFQQNGEASMAAAGAESDDDGEENYPPDDHLPTQSNNNLDGELANRSFRSLDVQNERPPTPEAPQLRRKAKGAVISFHFPVTEISPDSPSSEYWTAAGVVHQQRPATALVSDGGEWNESSCAYVGQDVPRVDDGFGTSVVMLSHVGALEGANDLDDNVSEDSYHLSDHEEVKEQQLSRVAFKHENNNVVHSSNYHNNKQSSSETPPSTSSTPLKSSAPLKHQRSTDLSPPDDDLLRNRFSPPPVSTTFKPVEIPSSSSAASTPPPRGLSGPLPGKVVTKVQVIAAKPKPIVPPKPKIRVQDEASEEVVISKSTVITREVSYNNSVGPSTQASVISTQRTEIAPQNVEEFPPPPSPPTIAAIPHAPPLAAGSAVPQAVPTIEVESEEYPDIKHKFFNGDIPYVLHVRRVTEAENAAQQQQPLQFSTFKEQTGGGGEYAALVQTRPVNNKNRSRSSGRPLNEQKTSVYRRKSLDLVQRKRLPSPGNFSSQDHSVSPDSEHDIVSFVSKWRNSSDGRKAACFVDKKRNKRNDPRRLTQPVKLFTPLAAKGDEGLVKEKKTVRSQPCLPINDDESGDELNLEDSPSLHDSMEALEKMDSEQINNSDLDTPPPECCAVESTSLPFAPRPGSWDPPYIDDDSSKSESHKTRASQFDECALLLASAAECLKSSSSAEKNNNRSPCSSSTSARPPLSTDV